MFVVWTFCPGVGLVLRVFVDKDIDLGVLKGRIVLVIVAGSTRTSTIPGISIAGPSPEATLYTPTLDVEYLIVGRPLTLDVVPVAPNGVPTPALITRSLAEHLGLSILVVDAGCVYEPRIPVVRLPSARPGGRIDVEPAMPGGTSERLFQEAMFLGKSLSRGLDGLVVGETIPGGTTTAAAILEALGYPGLTSSSSPSNPKELKKRVISSALQRLGGTRDVFRVIDAVGDPVHVSIAGIVAGALEKDVPVFLAGGTQMAAVLAILRSLDQPLPLSRRVAVLTTRWIVEDSSSSLTELVSRIGSIPVVAAWVSFSSSRHEGLRLYDKGYAKEGVAAGGAMVIGLVRGLSPRDVVGLVDNEYDNIVSQARPSRG